MDGLFRPIVMDGYSHRKGIPYNNFLVLWEFSGYFPPPNLPQRGRKLIPLPLGWEGLGEDFYSKSERPNFF